MTTGWADAAGRTGAPGAPRSATEQRFADALCGPDGTGDPAVLMPVLQVYPDALSAPMPDAMVAVPPVDPAAILAAARQAAPTPARARVAAQRAAAERVAQPGRYSRTQTQPAGPRPQRIREAPSARGALEPRGAVAPHPQGPRQPGTNPAPAGSAPRVPGNAALYTGLSGPTLRTTLSELGNFARSGFPALRPGASTAIPRMPAPQAPQAHAPTPPLPRNPQRRRNKGSSIWAVLVFLVIIAFASGIAQQIISAVSEMFNR